MDWVVFTASFWALVGLWFLPRGIASVWAAVKAVC